MKPQKTYNLSVLDVFKDVVNKKRDEHKDETSLDIILTKAKKDAMELVKLGFSPTQLKQVFKDANIEVSLHKIKQNFYKINSSASSRKPRISPATEQKQENITSEMNSTNNQVGNI